MERNQRPRPRLTRDSRDLKGLGQSLSRSFDNLKAKGEPENYGSRIRENNLHPSYVQFQSYKYNIIRGISHRFIYV